MILAVAFPTEPIFTDALDASNSAPMRSKSFSSSATSVQVTQRAEPSGCRTAEPVT